MQVRNRWSVLGLLFGVRLIMAFQFQSVASVSPMIMNDYGANLAGIGLLISLYLAPGLVFALPGGEIGRRFGDKAIVMLGLAMMVIGGLMMATMTEWSWQLAGRFIAGIGGVLLTVLMSKMVTDWFAGKEIATAMAIFVNSWPAGIALGLFALPPFASFVGVAGVAFSASMLAAIGLILFTLLYAPPAALVDTIGSDKWPTGPVLGAVVAAGCIWGLSNASLAMIFGFGTAMLTERGWTLVGAGSLTSLVLGLVCLSVPLGGVLADKTGRHNSVMLVGIGAFAMTLIVTARTEFLIPAFVFLGIVSGLPAGPIMSLPARVLPSNERAAGMGIYFTLFYMMVVAGPIIAGHVATVAETSWAVFDFGAVMLIACFPIYWIYEQLKSKALVKAPLRQ